MPIEPTDRAFTFKRSIGSNYVKVALRCGWVWIEEDKGYTGRFGIFGKRKKTIETYTKEDALNLVASINVLFTDKEAES